MRDALAKLPIPQRLLTVLLLLLGALMAPHVANLNPLIMAFFFSTILWRLVAMRRPGLMPGRWLLFLLMLSALALVMFSTDVTDGRLAGTALLSVMLGLKLLELRARRDINITIFLGFFLVLTQFLYNQSLWLAVYLFAGVAGLMSLQVGMNRVTIEPRLQLRNTLSMLAGALPLALVVFMLFPRLQSPLWGISSSAASTGISEEMTLGNIGQLTRSREIAFRVQFFGDAPAPSQRYWRGPVLWRIDGVRWSTGLQPYPIRLPVATDTVPIEYEITLEPSNSYWLFGLDVVTGKPASAHLNSNFSLVNDQPLRRRFTYRASSVPDLALKSLSGIERHMALQLPAEVSPRVRRLVRQWQETTDPAQPVQLVQKALAYYREQPFVYTLTPGVLGDNAIEQFLFETRRGFCEHYAGSFALMMRLAGIPTRVVIGYQGGEKNPHADHWVVRQSDAHAWTEVWLPKLGWWRIDPTAAVAPERIEQAIDSIGSLESDRVVFNVDSKGFAGALWRNVAWLADAADLGWHQWVVGFTAERQSNLLQSFGLRDLKGLGLVIALSIGSALAVTLVYLIARIPRTKAQDPLPSMWQRLLHKLQRAGVRAPPWHGPDTVCDLAAASHPEVADELMAIKRMYVQLRYGRNADRQQIGALRRRIDRLKLKRHKHA